MIEQMLSDLKLFGALNYYQKLEEENLTNEELLERMLKNEISWKEESRTTRRMKQATFPFNKEWGQLDLKKNPKIPFKKLMKYSNGDFLKDNKNICLIGAPGLGKTHSLVSLGRDLCRLGITVKFYTAIDLVTKLEEAKEDNKLSRLTDRLLRPQLLIIDELGFVPLSDNGARLLFDIFSKRYEKGSIAVSTNLSLPKWVQTFGSIELTNALIDRFSHRCDIYVFEGESYRYLESSGKN